MSMYYSDTRYTCKALASHSTRRGYQDMNMYHIYAQEEHW